MDRWRLISDPPLPGAENMAIDEAILRSSSMDCFSPPTLRLYSWRMPTISVGYLQDSTAYAGCGVPVVRRITGGRAVLHDMEITYSIVAGHENHLFTGGITAAYAIISKCIVAALNDAGIPAEFSPPAHHDADREKVRKDRKAACFHAPSRYEVLAGGKKLVGSAQRRFKDVFLQHGSILLKVDEKLNTMVFGPELMEKMTCIAAFGNIDPEALIGLIVKRLSSGLSAYFTRGGLDRSEEALMEALIENRYSRDEWNLSPGMPSYPNEPGHSASTQE